MNCDDNIILCEKDKNGILLSLDNHKRVDLMMNEESERHDYGMYWSRDFSLCPNHKIEIKEGKESTNIEVEHGKILKDIDELKHFFH